MPVNWFLSRARQRAPVARLICLPYAGGSAAVYRMWPDHVSADIEVLPVQLAGRGWRLREAPVADLGRIAGDLAEVIAGLGDTPFAVFGHSMGSWLGLEVVRRLEALGRSPLFLIASGRQAPVVGNTQPPMSHLDDGMFVDEVQRRYGGIPQDLLKEREMLALLLPALRADIAALEKYERVEAPVAAPIHAIVGATDPVVAADEITGWAQETRGAFMMRTFRGGHFFFQPDPRPLLEWVCGVFERALGTAQREAVVEPVVVA